MAENGTLPEEGEEARAGDAKGIPSEGQSENPSDGSTPPAQDQSNTVKASALATFHRQQKDFFAQQQAFKAKQAEYDKTQSVLANAKEDPLAALELLGYTDVKPFLERLAADGGRMSPERKKIQELENWKQAQEKQAQEQQTRWQQQQEQQVLTGKLDALRRDIQTRIIAEENKGTVLNIYGADEQIMLEMDRLASATGTLPDIAVAMKNVSDTFRGNLERLSDNPEVLEFFRSKLSNTKLSSMAPSQSKQRGTPQTIGRDTRSPGLRPKDRETLSPDGSAEEEEAYAFLRANTR